MAALAGTFLHLVNSKGQKTNLKAKFYLMKLILFLAIALNFLYPIRPCEV